MTLSEREQDTILHTYKRLPLEVSHGQGMYLYDTTGEAYLDFLGGIAVNALGYAHEKLLRAINAQANDYIHVSNYFLQKQQIELSERLTRATGYKRVFFCNSGTEANEASLKLARKWGSIGGKTEIISMHDGFHGRTMGSLSMMSSDEYRSGFGPFLDGFLSIPFNDVETLSKTVNEKTAAVILECIQGEGGINVIRSDYAQALSELKSHHGFLMIADEVQTGIGRTGKFLASEHFGLKPDLVTLAKPLGGGLPLGAMLVSEALLDVLKPGNHGTTFGGNPVACAAGNVVVTEVLEGGLMENAVDVGGYLFAELTRLQQAHPTLIKEIRGKGLMLGMELTCPGKPLVDAMLEKRIIINCTHSTVLRFVPPLIVQRNNVNTLIESLHSVLNAVNIES